MASASASAARPWLRRIAFAVILLGTDPCIAAPPAHEPAQTTATAPGAASARAPSDVYYEIFVRAWYDTDGDGIGDLDGVTAKLDYLQSLGVSGIWLMPINPSPSYHGYDVTDYEAVNPDYGRLADFDRLVAEAHRRGIAVIIDLVANHTSDRHPWFRAEAVPASRYHGRYTWADADTDLQARSATGGPAWHALGRRHYLGIFTGEMPDLDYDNPAVRAQMIRIGRFWLRHGADGFRLDAARHIYDDFAQAGPAVTARNVAWWRQFHAGLDAVDAHAWLVGEVTGDRPDKLAPYLQALDAVFDFPLAEKLIASARDERAGDLVHALLATCATYRASAGTFRDAPFLSNHDQQRVLSQLHGDMDHMRVAAAMLMTLPGHPFVYYGEELGLRGDKPDPDLREPMRWHRTPGHDGETTWKPLTANRGPAVSVDAQRGHAGALLERYRLLIGWRRALPVLRDGMPEAYHAGNDRVVAYGLADTDARVLVLHNLSGVPQPVALDATHAHWRVVRGTSPDVRIEDDRAMLPPYASAILQ